MPKGLPPIWDNYKKLNTGEKDTVKLWLMIAAFVFLGILCLFM